ncbi:MAG TPA: hypothetical protein VGX78_02530 [Pirellulales bacterium]|nr:hypothetical protein [Pirellulales bacterium]
MQLLDPIGLAAGVGWAAEQVLVRGSDPVDVGAAGVGIEFGRSGEIRFEAFVAEPLLHLADPVVEARGVGVAPEEFLVDRLDDMAAVVLGGVSQLLGDGPLGRLLIELACPVLQAGGVGRAAKQIEVRLLDESHVGGVEHEPRLKLLEGCAQGTATWNATGALRYRSGLRKNSHASSSQKGGSCRTCAASTSRSQIRCKSLWVVCNVGPYHSRPETACPMLRFLDFGVFVGDG